jgi:hypothetical protein
MESRVGALPHGNDDSKDVADTRCCGKGIGPIPITRSTPPTVEFALACQNATYMQWLIRQRVIERLPLLDSRALRNAWTESITGDGPSVHRAKLEDIHARIPATRVAANCGDETGQQGCAQVGLLIRHGIRELHRGASRIIFGDPQGIKLSVGNEGVAENLYTTSRGKHGAHTSTDPLRSSESVTDSRNG